MYGCNSCARHLGFRPIPNQEPKQTKPKPKKAETMFMINLWLTSTISTRPEVSEGDPQERQYHLVMTS